LATVAGPPKRHRRQKVQHALRLLDDDAALGDALEAEQAELAEPRVDVRQDIDGGGHLGERVTACVEGIDHRGHGVSSKKFGPDELSRPG